MFSLSSKFFRYVQGRVLPRNIRHIHTEKPESSTNSKDILTQFNSFRYEFTDFRIDMNKKISDLDGNMNKKISDLEAKMNVLPFQSGSMAFGMIVGATSLLGALGWNVNLKLKQNKK